MVSGRWAELQIAFLRMAGILGLKLVREDKWGGEREMREQREVGTSGRKKGALDHLSTLKAFDRL